MLIEVIIAGNIFLGTAIERTVNHPDFPKDLQSKMGTRWKYVVISKPMPIRTLAARYLDNEDFVYLNSKHKRSVCQNVGSVCLMRGLHTKAVLYRSREATKLLRLCTKICTSLGIYNDR